jgi:UDP-glucose:glycoprotein glucosyltransferase
MERCTLPTGASVGSATAFAGLETKIEDRETAAEENQASYFPLLDHIASGAFAEKSSEKDLYDEFLRIASVEGFLTNPEELSSFNLALSIHAAAPRIEAHFHYYENNLEPIMGKLYNSSCAAWLQWDSKQTCHLEGDYRDMMNGLERYPNDRRKLQFDRVLETQENKPAAILYGDIEAPEFRAHHERLRRYATEGYVSYRVRYRPPLARKERPLMLSGYGVSLVLKKSDYTVMDDRDVEGGEAKEKESTIQQPLGQLEDAETHDIRPLQGKDLAGLGYKAASFVMASEDPFRTLQRLVQDFPKHSAAIAATEVDIDVTTELQDNWEMFLGTGKNILWINGQRIEDSWMNAFTLLALLRRERRFVDGFKSLGLSSSEAIQLLSHNALAEATQDEKGLRFDYRDELEGGGVIIWMNDLERDSRYEQWSNHPNVLLRRVYPGQLHPFRKNLHNLVIPIDFTSKEDLHLIVENLQVFVKRKVAIRFGLAPSTITHGASVQARVIYHFLDAYGLQTALKYIEAILEKNDFATPSQKTFDGVRDGAELQADKSSLTLEEVLRDKTLEERIERAREWSRRLGTEKPIPPIFVNGQPIPKDDSWTSAMSMKLQDDMLTAARYVYENGANEESDLAAIYLEGVAIRRNPYIFPESDSNVKLVNIAEIVNSNTELFEKLPYVDTDITGQSSEISMWIIGDFDEQDGYELLREAAELQKDHPEVNLVLINNPQVLTEKPTLSTLIYQLKQAGALTPDILRKLLEEVKPANSFVDLPSVSGFMGRSVPSVKEESWAYPDHIESGKFWQEARALAKNTGVHPGQRAIIINGRVSTRGSVCIMLTKTRL